MLKARQDAAFAFAKEFTSAELFALYTGTNTSGFSRPDVTELVGGGAWAVFVDTTIAVVVHAIAACVVRGDFTTTSTGVSYTIVNDAVAVVVNAITCLRASWDAGGATIINDAVAVVVQTIAAYFCFRCDFVAASAPDATSEAIS